MITFIYPPVVLDKTGLATLTEQQNQSAALQDINTELDSQTALLALIQADTNQVVGNTAGASSYLLSIDTKVATSANQDAQYTELASIVANTAILSTIQNNTGSIDGYISTIDFRLTEINSKTPALGQALATASTPVVLTAAQIATLTPLTSISVSNFPGVQPVSGTVTVANPGLTDTQLRATPVPISGAVTSTVTGTVTANAGTNLNTSLLALDSTVAKDASLTTLNASVNTLLKPASTLAAVTAITNTVTIKADTAVNQTNPLKVDGSAITQPISAAALPLPTGASTSANQTTTNASLSSIDTKTPALGQSTMAASSPVTIASNQSAIPVSGVAAEGVAPTVNPVSISGLDAGGLKRSFRTDATGRLEINTAQSLPLPTGASTSANQVTTEAAINTLLKPASTLAAVTTIGTITNALPTGTNTIGFVKAAGKTSANLPARLDYAVNPVNTTAFVQLVASTTATASEIEIFDSSGQTLALAFGAAAAEVIQINIFPGGNGRVMLLVPAGTRVSIKAISGNATAGEININFLN